MKELEYCELGSEFKGTIIIGVEHPTRPEIIDKSYHFITVSDTGMGVYAKPEGENPFSPRGFVPDKRLNKLIRRTIEEVVCAQRPVQQRRHGFDLL